MYNNLLRVMNNSELQVADYIFVTFMAVELTVKIFAEGLIFTPNAMLKDSNGIIRPDLVHIERPARQHSPVGEEKVAEPRPISSQDRTL